MKIRRNWRSSLINRRRREARISRREEAYQKFQSGHEPLRQAEGGGVIRPSDQELVDFSNNSFSVDLSVDCIEDALKEYQGQPYICGVMTPNNGTNIYLTVTTSPD